MYLNYEVEGCQNYGLANLGLLTWRGVEKGPLLGMRGLFSALRQHLIRQTFDATFDGFRTLNIFRSQKTYNDL
jgi:hypothetical protein